MMRLRRLLRPGIAIPLTLALAVAVALALLAVEAYPVRRARALLEQLKSEDPQVRGAAIEKLTELRSPAAIRHIAQTAGESPEGYLLRRDCIAVIGKIGPPAVEPLIEIIREPYSRPPRRLRLLRRLWRKDNRRTKLFAVRILGALRDPRAVKPLMDHVSDEGYYPRGLCEYVVSRCGDEAVPPLLGMLEGGAKRLRERVAGTLALMRCPAATRALKGLLADGQPEVRICALTALCERRDGQMVEHFLAALRDGDPSVRAAALRLVKNALEPRLEEAAVPFLEDADAQVRDAAHRALWRSRHPRALEICTRAITEMPRILLDFDSYDLGRTFGGRAVGPLISLLGNAQSEVRLQATYRLGVFGSARVRKVLVALLSDEDAGVRRAAAGALGRGRSLEAVGAVAKALEDGDPGVRTAAAKALQTLGSPDAVEALREAGRDEDRKAAAAIAEALESLERAGASRARDGSPTDLETLERQVRSTEWHIRHNAVARLGGLRYTRAVDILIEALGDESDEIVARAALGLSELGHPKATEPLLKALRDPRERVRGAAAEALGQFNKGAKVNDALLASLQDPYEWVRVSAVRGIHWDRSAESVSLLMEAANDTSAEVRRMAGFALAGLGHPAAFEPLLEIFEDRAPRKNQPSLRPYVTRRIGALTDERVMEFLVGALSDSDAEVRDAALGSLKDRLELFPYMAFGGDVQTLGNFLEQTRKYRPYRTDLRPKAVWLLGEANRPEAIPYLIEALEDTDLNVSRAATETIARYLHDDRVTAALIKALKHEDRYVRRHALQTLKDPFEVGAYGAIMDLLGDEDDEVRRAAESALKSF